MRHDRRRQTVPRRGVRLSPALAWRLVRYAQPLGQRELGGFLLGQRQPPSRSYGVSIQAVLLPPQALNDPQLCAFEPNTTAVALDALTELPPPEGSTPPHEPRTQLVGWFHTHPKLGAFFSETDAATFEQWARLDPQAVAIVLDPIDPLVGRRRWYARDAQSPVDVQMIEDRGADLTIAQSDALIGGICQADPRGGRGWRLISPNRAWGDPIDPAGPTLAEPGPVPVQTTDPPDPARSTGRAFLGRTIREDALAAPATTQPPVSTEPPRAEPIVPLWMLESLINAGWVDSGSAWVGVGCCELALPTDPDAQGPDSPSLSPLLALVEAPARAGRYAEAFTQELTRRLRRAELICPPESRPGHLAAWGWLLPLELRSATDGLIEPDLAPLREALSRQGPTLKPMALSALSDLSNPRSPSPPTARLQAPTLARLMPLAHALRTAMQGSEWTAPWGRWRGCDLFGPFHCQPLSYANPDAEATRSHG